MEQPTSAILKLLESNKQQAENTDHKSVSDRRRVHMLITSPITHNTARAAILPTRVSLIHSEVSGKPFFSTSFQSLATLARHGTACLSTLVFIPARLACSIVL